MPKGQYERRNREVDDGKREEIVTGIPATDEVPVGSTQFDAFKQHAEEVRENIEAPLGQTYQPIEANVSGDIGMPITRIEEMADDSVRSYSRDVRSVRAQAAGKTLTVTATTVHGSWTTTAEVDKWNEANVKKALSEIEKKNSGEDGGDTAPKDRLADAVRDVAANKE